MCSPHSLSYSIVTSTCSWCLELKVILVIRKFILVRVFSIALLLLFLVLCSIRKMQVPLHLLCDDLLLPKEATGNMYKF